MSVIDLLLTAPATVPTADGDGERPVRVAVIFTKADLLIPDGDLRSSDAPIIARLIDWAQTAGMGDRHLFLMLAESYLALHSELRRASARWEAIHLPLPSASDRAAFLAFLEQHEPGIPYGAGLDRAATAARTGALTLMQVEDIVLRAIGEGGLTPAVLDERKRAVISREFADVLAEHPPRFTLDDVGGYVYLKTFLRERVVPALRQGRLPMGGLLLSGPPGTGKTQLAEALAGEAGLPFVTFALAKILGEFVGNSERNLERALHAVLSLAPCVLFLDELDQLTGRGEHAGSGVDNRIFARLLTFLEDPARRTAGVLVVAATNRPDLLDPALRSRFDRTAPVLPPTEEDRRAMVVTLAQRYGITLSEHAVATVATHTEGWVGRNLRDLMAVVAEFVGDGMESDAAVEMALAVYRPAIRDTAEFTRLALADISDLRLVPPQYHAMLRALVADRRDPGDHLTDMHIRRTARRGGVV
jgi:MoxR-like ATPase